MVQLNLPKNSHITEGKTWPRIAGANETCEYRIYRRNPEDDKNWMKHTRLARCQGQHHHRLPAGARLYAYQRGAIHRAEGKSVLIRTRQAR